MKQARSASSSQLRDAPQSLQPRFRVQTVAEAETSTVAGQLGVNSDLKSSSGLRFYSLLDTGLSSAGHSQRGIQKTLVKLHLMQTETGRAPGSQVEARKLILILQKYSSLTLSSNISLNSIWRKKPKNKKQKHWL